MNKELPDVASNEAPQIRAPLEWVGMSRIDIPIHLSEPGCPGPVHAVVDAQVNLPAVTVKGIHMSRIYRMLDEMSSQEAIAPGHLRKLLEQMVDSHHDCYTDGARVVLDFSLLARRAALRSPELAGWKAYPVQLEAKLDQKSFSLRASVQVEYSSTCPCSAALSRQLVADGFRKSFPESAGLMSEDVAVWLEQNATLATPHSQRSEARVSVDIPESAGDFGLMRLIDQVEAVLATPVQTAVKRADEQAFAWLNGQNLMYVEDAARRIQSALTSSYDNLQTHVRHLESLHSHDAVASASGDFQGVI
ncbi:GTP cyclohydrolase FolE2 [Marinobacter shengliensis]|jgi:GTP cyclohydrolase I|uniref:GTP cyclohydrolase FolE2 n=1 Tax=Marinobacter shengliensis TaxID=1389223 RepID=UPI002573CE83|nr:GTP cyclohydrolase FolE2 [Marinobacter shengliensis]BEH15564.1 GTP cyclohydrolase FolE2 [Marinobacter shengliensis]